MDEPRIAIDAGFESGADLRAGAQKIELLELDAGGVLTAAAAEGDAGVERPHVLRGDFDVDHTLMKRDRPDLRVAQVSCVAQDARRLLDQARRDTDRRS